MSEEIEIIKWECPECGEDHEDPEGVETHCRKCGLIVTPYDGFTHDEGKYVTDRASELYLEIVDARTGDARQTGLGAIFDTDAEAWQAFESTRSLHTDGGGFFLDLHTGNGDLADTIELTAEGVERVSGVKPESPEYYVEYDEKQWADAIAELKQAKKQ